MPQKPPCILIVDDDADTLANLSDILSDKGFCVSSASDGEVALAKIAHGCPLLDRQFDLCLVDYKMPGMNGAELLEKIQQSEPGLRAIMITAYSGDQGARDAVDAGATTVLAKPVDIDHLLELIETAVC